MYEHANKKLSRSYDTTPGGKEPYRTIFKKNIYIPELAPMEY